ncbi:hypothetical protein BV898_01803 [Hypsibius exemplaris]|uniref:DUF19 domain-containing protein n=1 Tax=Hypsibius exemplaris TaxID=2072580 RepID=A0A1W0X9U5_HYPEX|nr:hypothetical protein BV898_01803 [Hypsibius exemplaris]
MDFYASGLLSCNLPRPRWNWQRCCSRLFLFFVLAYSTDARRSPNECSETDFSECLKSFDTIIAHQNLGFAATEDELNAACRYLKEGVTCIDQFVKRCTRDKAQQDSLTVSVKGAFDILELLCEDTYHRNQYLQHAECYRRIAPQIEDCMQPMRTMGLRQQGGSGVPAKSKVDQIVCCAYHNATECIHQVSVKECSDRAATFLKNYTDRAAYPITLQCRGFNSKVCSAKTSDSCGPSAASPAWLAVPVMAAAYIINV